MGDFVLAKNELSQLTSLQKVTRIWTSLHLDSYSLTVLDQNQVQHQIQVSGNHPFMQNENGQQVWTKVDQLEIGDSLETASGKLANVFAITYTAKQYFAFDLTVDIDHTYFVGEGIDAWVHNCYDTRLKKLLEKDEITAATKAERTKIYKDLENKFKEEFNNLDPKPDNIDQLVKDKMKSYYVTGHVNTKGEYIGKNIRRNTNAKDGENAYDFDAKGNIIELPPGSLERSSLRVETKQDIYKAMSTQDRINAGITKNDAGKWELKDGNEWHHGHKEGYENWRINRIAADNGLTQQQLNDFVNSRPDYFKMQKAKENLDHKGEDPSPYGKGPEEDQIKSDIQDFKDEKGIE